MVPFGARGISLFLHTRIDHPTPYPTIAQPSSRTHRCSLSFLVGSNLKMGIRWWDGGMWRLQWKWPTGGRGRERSQRGGNNKQKQNTAEPSRHAALCRVIYVCVCLACFLCVLCVDCSFSLFFLSFLSSKSLLVLPLSTGRVAQRNGQKQTTTKNNNFIIYKEKHAL